MLLQANLSAGDFLDRYSILLIKKNYGLEVSKEIISYESQLQLFEPRGLEQYLRIIRNLNECLWQLEDSKRTEVIRGSTAYTNVSEMITQINDLRFQTKKAIDTYFKSDLSEEKSHKF
jgi:hypothetical protein